MNKFTKEMKARFDKEKKKKDAIKKSRQEKSIIKLFQLWMAVQENQDQVEELNHLDSSSLSGSGKNFI